MKSASFNSSGPDDEDQSVENIVQEDTKSEDDDIPECEEEDDD